MSDVTLSKAVRSNLLHLQNTAQMMDRTQERLATGKKVNSALDNPTNFFTAASLNGRAADIGTLLDAMSNGIQVIEAADNGLSAITKTIESMQSTLRQARQDKSFQTASLPLAASRTGELTLSGGGFPLGQSFQIPLTNAIPASVTAGADYALEGTQAGLTFAFGGSLTFDDDGDNIEIGIQLDGGAVQSVVIDRALVNDITGGDVISNADAMGNVLAAAIGTQFGTADFEVHVDGTDIRIASGTRGASSAVSIASVAVTDGGGANDLATATQTITTTGTPANIDPDIPEFTIDYGGVQLEIALDGDVHTDANLAIQHINDEIAAWNADPANSDDQINVTAVAQGGRIVLRGPADGTGPAISVFDTTPASGATDTVFGNSSQRQVVAPSVADGPAKTVDQLVRDINANPEFKNIIRASNDNGRLRIENLSTTALDIDGLTDGEVSGGVGTTSVDGNDYRASLARQFNDLRTELDRLADDASYNGINLLRGDQLKIVFNENGTSTIEIQAKNAKGEPRSINVANLNILEVAPEDMNLDETIDGLLAKLQISLNEVRAQAATLGSTLSVVQNRQNFTKEMINTLQSGAANLTLTDSNEEAANMLALQTRQQLSQTALSLASQADQSVLRLFG